MTKKASLSDLETVILELITIEGGLSIEEVATKVHSSPHVVRYSLRKLRAHRFVYPHLSFNVFRLGLQEFSFYFSVKGGSRARKAVRDFLIARDTVSWFVELAGEFQYTCNIWARNYFDLKEFLDDLSAAGKGVIGSRSYAAVLSVTAFSYSGKPGTKVRRADSYKGPPSVSSMDLIDHKILSLSARSPDSSTTQAAKHLKMPVSSLNYRLAKLKRAGVIQGLRYRVDTHGARLQAYRVLVTSREFGSRITATLIRLSSENPAVFYFAEQVGDWDFEIGFLSPTSDAAIAFREKVEDEMGEAIEKTAILSESKILKGTSYPMSVFESSAGILVDQSKRR